MTLPRALRFDAPVSPAAAALQFEPLAADPLLASLKAAALAGNVPAVEHTLGLSPGEDHRGLAAEQVLYGPMVLPRLLAFAATPAGWRARGLMELGYAWHARGDGFAASVTQAQAAAFHFWADAAELSLARAQRLSPKDPLIPALRLNAARALAPSPETRAELWRAVAASDPFHYLGARSVSWLKASRWYGKPGEQLGFVTELLSRAPAGRAVWDLCFEAHLMTATDAGQSPVKTFTAPDTLHALYSAADARGCFTGPAGDPTLAYARSCAIVVAVLAGDAPRARAAFLLAPQLSLGVWSALGAKVRGQAVPQQRVAQACYDWAMAN